jgi:hypothetical protein
MAGDSGSAVRASGGAALRASAGGAAGAGAIARSRLRTALALAHADARLLLRSRFVLAGLIAGGVVIWLFTDTGQPLWWNVAWVIGYGQVFLAMAVLIAAHFAAGRPSRDAMADLYASFPTKAGTRVLAQLIGLAGAAPASLLLIGGAAAGVEIAGAIGDPSSWDLAAGLLLVIAAGAAGIALGTRFPHPLAGVLAALVLFIPFSQSNRLSGPGIWLYPWIKPPQLATLPGPTTGYPPAAAHAAELAGIAVLAGAAALALTISSAPARGVLAMTGILALAATCLAGAAQLRPIPASDVNHLVRAAADPVSAQHCTTAGQGRYCLYAGFGGELPAIEAPVSAVLARLPVHLGQQLTVQQAAPLSPDLTLTHGHPEEQVSRWNAQLQRVPGYGGGSASVIYLPVSVRPADARFALALASAESAVHLSPTITSSNETPCLPVDQAREAIAIWLALVATHTPAGRLQSGLDGPDGQQNYVPVSSPRPTAVAAWNYPGQSLGSEPIAGPQPTAAGYLLASAMTSLPVYKVVSVLQAGWARWTDWHTTDGQLAAALGLQMPAVPQSGGAPPPGGQLLNPVCTT